MAKRKNSDSNCLSPEGEFWDRLEQAIDLSKSILDKRKGVYATVHQLKCEKGDFYEAVVRAIKSLSY